MPNVTLNAAVAKIYQVVKQRNNRDHGPPFFFIAGAGMSYPQIPLARDIEAHCRKEAESYGDSALPESTTPIDSYSHWFGKAYPSAEELQNYLRKLMEDKPISKANLRLAHLLLDGSIARTVFTSNFDDMISKALELFGERPLICDHPLTVSRMRIESGDIQIIHVHGSYWFYDCCNLKEDIKNRSGNALMSVMLDQSLRDHSPLILGYSGWEGDILMSALRRRLEAGKLGVPIYWFCYKRDNLDALPKWLTEHNDVYFVLPDEPIAAISSSSISSSEPDADASGNLSLNDKVGDSLTESKAPTLPADRAIDALVNKFALPAPPLTENPLNFYAERLKDLLGPRDTEPDTYYGFHTVIERVERAMNCLEAQGPDRLRRLRDAMSRADYRGAVEAARDLNLGVLAANELRETLNAVADACDGLLDDSAEEIAGYDLLIQIANLLETNGPLEASTRERIATALYNKGITLGTLGNSEEAIVAYNELLRRFGDAEEPAIIETIANTLFNKGSQLRILNKNEEAIAVYDELLRRFADAQAPAIIETVAGALANRGNTLRRLDRNEEAIAAYDEILLRFAHAREPELRERIARALLNKGAALGVLSRSEEAIAVYDELLRRFADAQEPVIIETIASALLNKGVRLAVLKRSEEAIAVYDELLRRFADAQEPEIRETIAMALRNKGFRLGTLNRSEEAIAVYDELLRRFTDAQELPIQAQVAKALINKAAALGALNRSEEQIAAYNELLHRFAESEEPVIQEQVAKARSKLR
jgi:tetratricopeptide (TPR) repeat protein